MYKYLIINEPLKAEVPATDIDEIIIGLGMAKTCLLSVIGNKIPVKVENDNDWKYVFLDNGNTKQMAVF